MINVTTLCCPIKAARVTPRGRLQGQRLHPLQPASPYSLELDQQPPVLEGFPAGWNEVSDDLASDVTHLVLQTLPDLCIFFLLRYLPEIDLLAHVLPYI